MTITEQIKALNTVISLLITTINDTPIRESNNTRPLHHALLRVEKVRDDLMKDRMLIAETWLQLRGQLLDWQPGNSCKPHYKQPEPFSPRYMEELKEQGKIRPCVTCGEIWVTIPDVQCGACNELLKK